MPIVDKSDMSQEEKFMLQKEAQDKQIIECASMLIHLVNESGRSILNDYLDEGFGSLDIYVHDGVRLKIGNMTHNYCLEGTISNVK